MHFPLKVNAFIFEMNKSLIVDNNDLLTQLDKFYKRIKQLESERDRDQDN